MMKTNPSTASVTDFKMDTAIEGGYKNVALRKAYGVGVDKAARQKSAHRREKSFDMMRNDDVDHPKSDSDRGQSAPEHRGMPSPTPTSGAAATNNVMAEFDRLKNTIHERDRMIFRLKQEIGVMKQIERRQQRDLDQLQSLEEDAPKIIRLLKDELQGFKVRWLRMK